MAKHDPKAKAKRQKIIAVGGGVLLLAILAFQVPRTMKMLNAEPPPSARPAEVAPGAAPSSDPSVLPTPGLVGGGAAPAASGDGTLVDSDPAPVASNGQLISFGSFASKDPFVEQIDPSVAGGGGSSGSTAAPSGVGTGTSTSTGTSTGTGTGGGVPATIVPVTPATGSPGVAGSAVISVNGVEETVTPGAEFPKDAPVFRLAKVVGGEVKIGIAGGALASGSPTITLRKGKAVTLVNTADGTRYELKLVSVG